MERVARLLNASEALRRKIWASMPLRIRVAEFFTRLAVSPAEAFGRTVYAEFLTHGIEGMPDIKGQPASEFDITRKPLANYLPRDYGVDFGKKAYLMLMSKFHNPAMVEDTMSIFLIRFLDGVSDKLKPGSSLRDAQFYVLRALTNEGHNVLRKKTRQREDPDTYLSQGEEMRHELPIFDEDLADKQFRSLPAPVRRKLEAIHPDAPLYVKLSIIDGHTDREIIGDIGHGTPSMLNHPYSKQGKPLNEKTWNMTYKPKILDALRSSYEDLRISV